MSRYRGPRLRITRRLGDLPVHPEGRAVLSPGRTAARRKRSEYAIRLKRSRSSASTTAFQRQLVREERREGDPLEPTLKLLETGRQCLLGRFRAHRPGARQVNHGHVTVNGRVTDIASYHARAAM